MNAVLRPLLAIVLLVSVAWSALLFKQPTTLPTTSTDPILEVHGSSLTTYLPAVSNVQDIRPLVGQRGVNLDGSLRAGSTQGFAAAGNPFENAWRAATVNGVRLDTGTYEAQDVDFALPAEGFSWVIGRTFNARQQASGGAHRDSDGPQGKNWFQNSQPEIVLYEHATQDEEDVLVVLYGADRFAEYKRVDIVSGTSDTFEGVNGTGGVVLYQEGGVGEPDTYTVLDPMGHEFWFFGFDADANPAEGQLWKVVDGASNTAFVGNATTGSTAITSGFDSGGRITTAYDSSDRRYTYTYTTLDSVDRLTGVKAETKTGGTWASPTGLSTVGKVDYGYYSNESYGDVGDLKLVTITTPLSDAGIEQVRKKYYRYWEGTFNASTNPGHPHALKYVVDFEGTRQQDWQDATFDDDFLTINATTLEPYASAFFEYDANHRVSEAWFNGDCGCSGGNTGTHRFEYETNGSFSNTAATYDEEWKTRTVVQRPDGSYLTQFFDEAHQGLDRLLTDADPDGTSPAPSRWLTHVVRDSSGLVTSVYSPAVVTGYTHSTGAGTFSTSAGLVTSFVRETTGAMTGFPTARKWAEGTSGTAYFDKEWEWTQGEVTTFASVTLDRELVRPLVDKTHAYQVESTSTTNRITTELTPVCHSSSVLLSSNKQTNPDLSLGARSPASGTEKTPHYREDGSMSFTVAEDDIVEYVEYTNGQVTKRIQDADTGQTGSGQDFENETIPSSVSSTSGAVHRVTAYAYDAQGRLDTVTQPDGQVLKSYYSQLADGRLVVLRYPNYETSPSTKYFGPVQYSVQDHAGNTVAQATVALTGNESTSSLTAHVDETDSDPITAMDLGTLVRLTTNVYSKTGGKLEETRLYFDIPASGDGTDGTNYDPTLFGYDDSGRRTRTKEAHGTIRRSVYDAVGRMSASWVGTNDSTFDGGESSGTDDMVKIDELEYDSGNDDGNSHVTKRTLFVEDSTTGQRVTSYTHDVRGRVLVEDRPTAPHAFHAYDNEGRRTATALYSSTASINASSDDPVTEATNRLALSQTKYDKQGRVEGTRSHKIDPADGSDDDFLYTEITRDEAGRVLTHRGKSFTKTHYDRLGRQTHRFVLADTNDTTYANAFNAAGDTVLEEHQTVYESSDSDEVLMRVALSRYQNASTSGPLDSNADSDDLAVTAANLSGRADITAMWYDRFGRVTDTVRYGTYGGSTFDRDGLSVPARSDTALRTTITYTTDGTPQEVEDPRGLVARTEYDDAGRQTKSIRNYDASVNGGNPSGSADNQTVRYEYTDGLRTKIIADLPSGSTDQETLYTYGTTKGASAGDSEYGTGHLLQEVQYPDSSGGTDVVTLAYNAQGELTYRKDQSGNVLEYDYDDSGRQTHQRVTTLASGFDGDIRRISRTYTDLGEAELVTQYDNATVGSGSVTDEVQYSYDAWRHLETFEQDRNSAVGASGSIDDYEVSYTYEKATAGRLSTRKTGMTLPNGDVVTYTYDLDVDDEASRVSKMKRGEVTLVKYLYLGAERVVGTSYEPVNISNVLYGTTSGTYPNLDRFGRVTSTIWTSNGGTSTDFHDVDYAYDRNSNVIRAEDNVHVGFDVEYTIDDLDRVAQAEDGTWNGSAITSTTRDQVFTLDQVGNWDHATLDLNGDADLLDADEYDDDRSHNDVNELTARDVDDDGTNDYTFAYDAVGNMTDDGETYKYVYDAYGRLREILDRTDDSLVAEYVYNGLGFLISTHEDTDDDGDVDTSDKWFHSVFDEGWRRVGTFREDDSDPKEQFVPHQAGTDGRGTSSYIDLVAIRDRDDDTAWTSASDGTLEQRIFYCQNWRADLVALVHAGPLLVEWVSYSAYGIPFGKPGGDAESDGDADTADGLQTSAWINASTYDVRGDIDIDGDLDQADLDNLGLYYLGESVGWSRLSWNHNKLGFGGLSHLSGSTIYGLNRRLLPHQGRWARRDPLRYSDSNSLYEAFASSPITNSDPLGLERTVGTRPTSNPSDPDEIPSIDDGELIIIPHRPSGGGSGGGGGSGFTPGWAPKSVCEAYFKKRLEEGKDNSGIIATTFCHNGKPVSCFNPSYPGIANLGSLDMLTIINCSQIHEDKHKEQMNCKGVADFDSPTKGPFDEKQAYQHEYNTCWKLLRKLIGRNTPLYSYLCNHWCPLARGANPRFAEHWSCDRFRCPKDNGPTQVVPPGVLFD